MASPDFEATVRHHDGAALLDMKGEINSFADEALNAAYTQAAEGEGQVIVLNFENVSYINSTGIALIVGLLAQARKNHREIRVFGLSEHYQHLFEITRLVDFMGIYQDEKSALV